MHTPKPFSYRRAAPLLCVMVLLLITPAAAQNMTLNFQQTSLIEQDVKIFNSTGGLYGIYNTSSVIELPYVVNGTNLWTVQIQPSAATADPVDTLGQVFSMLTQNLLVVFLVVIGLLLIFGRRR